MWMDVINNEMENLKVVFDILEWVNKIPVDHHKASGYLLFYVRVTLEHQVRWVEDRNSDPESELSNIAGDVSREMFALR